MVAELVETARLWGRVAAVIDPRWAERLAGPLARRTYSEPRWDAERGQAVADERVMLYGVPLVAGRRVALSRIDPPLAREMFVRHALVQGEWRCAAISVGRRPQFYDNGFVLVEVYLPGFTGDLYGLTLDVAFLAHLRPEMTFDGVDGLLVQMAADVEAAKEIFTTFTPASPFLLR
jgi:hypothetical protein